MDLDRHLAREMLVLHPVESSRILETLSPAEAADILAGLEPDKAAPVLRNMGRGAAAAAVTAIPPERGAAVIAALPADIGGHILRRMETHPREALLARVSGSTGDALRSFLDFAEGTAGMLMNPDIPILPRDLQAREARRRIGERSDVQDPVYVVDDNQVLTGALPLTALFTAPPEARVESLQRVVNHTLPASTGLHTILVHPGWQDTASLPVVDDRGVLLGALNSRRLRRLENELRGAREGDETAEALGDLFRTGFNALLNSALATSQEIPPPTPGDKP